METIRVFEAFAGYGGASFALKRAQIPHEVVMYSEFDKHAQKLFETNHPNIKRLGATGDINIENLNSIPEFDLFTGGFPCQPFSSAGLGKGELDPRGTLFYPILKIVESHRPKHILLENVKGMTHKKHLPTFNKILHELKLLGYHIDYAILNTKDYGIPQNRERLWIYASLLDNPTGLLKSVKKVELTTTFNDLLDPNNNIDVGEDLFLNYIQVKRLLEKHRMPLHLFDGSTKGLCLDIYNKKLKTDGLSITLTEPHHNGLRVVEPIGFHNRKYSKHEKTLGYSVRKLSVNEHFRLMGFNLGEIDFANQSYQQLCKRAGNGWDINVVSRIFTSIFKS